MGNQVTFQETIKTNKDQNMDASGDALMFSCTPLPTSLHIIGFDSHCQCGHKDLSYWT